MPPLNVNAMNIFHLVMVDLRFVHSLQEWAHVFCIHPLYNILRKITIPKMTIFTKKFDE